MAWAPATIVKASNGMRGVILAAVLGVFGLLPKAVATEPPAAAANANPSAIQVAPVTRVPAASVPVPTKPVEPQIAAKALFGAVHSPADLVARSIGTYAKGCLSGAQMLPVDGAEWQAMRLSRDRNWGHPSLLLFLEHFASDARRFDGWPGLLVGDMSQPRGGPMVSSHASHQLGLDVDLWYQPMPSKRLSKDERETKSAESLLAPGGLSVDPQRFTADHIRLLKRAASFGEVERIFVHPAIKKALCQVTLNDVDRIWLIKMRPFWGHDDHFHVRIRCPEGDTNCHPQAPVPGDDGCGKELDDWFARLQTPPKPSAVPETPVQPLTLDKLPVECRAVLAAPGGSTVTPRLQ